MRHDDLCEPAKPADRSTPDISTPEVVERRARRRRQIIGGGSSSCNRENPERSAGVDGQLGRCGTNTNLFNALWQI
jgi:hypothetical protein